MGDYNARVSVGLPVYNGEKFIRETLDSILAQTLEDFELIICDNASTDKTQQICEEYANKDRRIRYYRNDKNLGAGRNFNLSFELSRSDYFKWVAVDDPCAPTFLEKCLEVLINEPDFILCYPRTIVIDERGTFLQKYDNNLYLKSESPIGRFLQLMFNSGLVNPVYGLIRAKELRKTRLLGNFPRNDVVLIGELSLLGKFKEIPEYLCYRRIHPDSSWGSLVIGNKWIITKSDNELTPFFNPDNPCSILSPHLTYFYEQLISIKRSPIRLATKVNLGFFILGSFLLHYRPVSREITASLKKKLSQVISNCQSKNDIKI